MKALFGDTVGGATLGGVAGAATGALTAAAVGACAPVIAGTGLTIGVPLGAIIGSALWLKHLIEDHIAKKSDEAMISDLLEKLKSKTATFKDFEKIDRIKTDYKDDLATIANKSGNNINTDSLEEADIEKLLEKASKEG